MEFSQKQRAFKVSATLSESFLEYRMKRGTENEVQAFIPYEDLTGDLVGKVEKKPFLLLLFALCLLGFAGTLERSWAAVVLFGSLSVLFVFLYFWERHRLLMLKGRTHDVCVLNNAEGRRFRKPTAAFAGKTL